MAFTRSVIVFVALSLLLVNFIDCFDFHEKELETEKGLWQMYERWRSHHTVSKSFEEKNKRFNVFKHNVKYVHEFNKLDKPYKLKLNKFADMTSHEFGSVYAGSKIRHHRMLNGIRDANRTFRYENMENVPLSVDWRKKGAVTGIKDQGQCGSCWAFSTIAAVEGVNQIKTKQLVSLSEQELVDCDTSGNSGCSGGLMDLAFQFIQKTGGITSEENYPYLAADGVCDESKMSSKTVSIDGYEDVPVNNEKALLKAVANQPVAVAIDASGSDFQFYSEGVFSGTCGTELDHGVAIVGYGATLFGTKYWIVRNSWGTEWGEHGYIRMKRDVLEKEGLCGIAMEASYPTKLSPTKNIEEHKDEL